MLAPLPKAENEDGLDFPLALPEDVVDANVHPFVLASSPVSSRPDVSPPSTTPPCPSCACPPPPSTMVPAPATFLFAGTTPVRAYAAEAHLISNQSPWPSSSRFPWHSSGRPSFGDCRGLAPASVASLSSAWMQSNEPQCTERQGRKRHDRTSSAK